jgi:uncharacterized protein (DUF1330 family)
MALMRRKGLTWLHRRHRLRQRRAYEAIKPIRQNSTKSRLLLIEGAVLKP